METRSSEREGGEKKKDKNQNLQTDKCISSFLNPFICASEMLQGYLCPLLATTTLKLPSPYWLVRMSGFGAST